MLIGYARVSTDDQDFALQEDAPKNVGCNKIYYDKMSGARSERPGLREALDYLRDGEDCLVVWRLDRLGRSLLPLLDKKESYSGEGCAIGVGDNLASPPNKSIHANCYSPFFQRLRASKEMGNRGDHRPPAIASSVSATTYK